ncbi:MAG: hypothetical protein AAGN15_19140 [Cyanobacteria bacterium J06581_3]
MPSKVEQSLLDSLLSSLTKAGIPVVVGPEVGGWSSYADQNDAAVLLLAVGQQGLPQTLPSPVHNLAKNGQAVAVSLAVSLGEQSGPTPIPDDVICFDLGTSITAQSKTFQGLVDHLRALIESRLGLDDVRFKLNEQVSATLTSVEHLKTLTAEIAVLSTVLSEEEAHSSALRETLGEISRTYEVVQDAIETFREAGLTLKRSEGKVFARLAGGMLKKHIHNGRAHCTRLNVRYKRTGGLRDEVKERLSPDSLDSLDRIFEELANADFDVFLSMDDLGEALTVESRAIVRLLLTDRKDSARNHVALATERLMPLEEALENALLAFQHIQSSLGYAEPAPREKEEVHVTNQTITIHGDVVNSNIVAAAAITDSFNRFAKSEVQEDMKSALTALHKATAELTTRLPADEAERAACDLAELTAEATSESPRRAFWKRANEGLLSAAEKVAKAGVPVIELVNRVTGMLGSS